MKDRMTAEQARDEGFGKVQIDIEQAIEAAPPPPPPELVVTGAFSLDAVGYAVGNVITDARTIKTVLEAHAAYVVPRYPQREKSDTQA